MFKRNQWSLKELSQNPAMLIIYIAIAIIMVANIFISGYLFGRAHQTIDDLRPVTPLSMESK